MSYPPPSGSPYPADPQQPAGAGSAPQADGYGAPAAGPTMPQPDPYAPAGAFSMPPQPDPYGYGAPQPAAGPTVKRRKPPAILLAAGAVVAVVAAIVLAVSAVPMVNATNSMAQIAPTGTSTASLKADSDYGLYGNGSSTCNVTGPDGSNVQVSPPSSDTSTTLNNKTMFGHFTTTASGDHTISCTTSGVQDVYVGNAISMGGVVGTVAGVLIGIALGVVGVALLIAGGVWLGVRSSGNKKALQGQISSGYTGAGQWPGA